TVPVPSGPPVRQLPAAPVDEEPPHAAPANVPALSAPETSAPAAPAEAVVRVTAQSLTRLMSLAGESLVQARWLQPFSMALLRLKNQQDHLAGMTGGLGEILGAGASTQVSNRLEEIRKQMALCRQILAERASEFEDHAASAEDLNSRLYNEVIVSRMRPFAD